MNRTFLIAAAGPILGGIGCWRGDGDAESDISVTLDLDPQLELEQRVASASSLNELAETLELLLSSGVAVWTDGRLYLARQLVDRIKGLRIEIRLREHPPPHFHVRASDIDAAFSVADGSHLWGDIDGRNLRLVQWWYPRARSRLIEIWNDTRPTNCPVGMLKI